MERHSTTPNYVECVWSGGNRVKYFVSILWFSRRFNSWQNYVSLRLLKIGSHFQSSLMDRKSKLALSAVVSKDLKIYMSFWLVSRTKFNSSFQNIRVQVTKGSLNTDRSCSKKFEKVGCNDKGIEMSLKQQPIWLWGLTQRKYKNFLLDQLFFGG